MLLNGQTFYIISDIQNSYNKKYVGKSGTYVVKNGDVYLLNVDGEYVVVNKHDIVMSQQYVQVQQSLKSLIDKGMTQKQAAEALITMYQEGIRITELFL